MSSTKTAAQTSRRVAEQRRRFNIGSYLPAAADRAPDRPAVIMARKGKGAGRGHPITCCLAELEALSNRYANGLVAEGFERGMRVLLMIKPGLDFVAVVFALYKMGAIPVMIDPGMGIGRFLKCIEQAKPRGMIAVPIVQAMRLLRPHPFRCVQHGVTVGRRRLLRGPTLGELAASASDSFSPVDTDAIDMAAILFTSGSTGPAKGVVYEHGMFDAQIRMIQSTYGIQPGEVDLPGFPLFALFSIAMGMTTVFADMNPSHPARVDPARIVRAIHEHDVTSTFGSPAMWNRVSDYCLQTGTKLSSLRRVLIAGAPVPWRLIERIRRVLPPGADVHIPYGATESLPISSISGREVLDGLGDQTRTGHGICVGAPLPEIDVEVIEIRDEAISNWSDAPIVSPGTVGEFVVSGPVVTREYFDLPEATARAKIRDGAVIRHRIGDVGYRDDAGRLWFCGRKDHRVETGDRTMFSVCCEALFNEHPDVFRSALVGIGPRGGQTPVIVIEPVAGRFPRGGAVRRFREELRICAAQNERTATIENILFHPSFPVDVRHNAKINREQLAAWAAGKIA